MFLSVALFSRKIAVSTLLKSVSELCCLEMGNYAFQYYVQPKNFSKSLALETYLYQYSFYYLQRFSTSSVVFLAFAC
jgi:hypothetical protein